MAVSSATPVIGPWERELEVDDVSRGLLLLGELNCAACHDLGANAGWVESKPAPDLQNVGSRVDFEWLKAYVPDPHAIKPGTTMPGVLANKDARDRSVVANAIAHYLSSLGTNDRAETVVQPGSVERGRALYHSVGCVACHSPEQELPGSVPLGKVEEKYHLAGLVSFLKDPLAVRPGGRMPDFPLEHDEAVDLATYLLQGGASTPAGAPDSSLVTEGRRHFREQRCVSCHQVEDARLGSPPARTALTNLDSGCLSGGIGEWPDFDLSAGQIAAIQVALSEPISERSNEERIHLSMLRLNCVACHERDGFGGVSEARDQWFESHDPNVGEQGRIPPMLTRVGAKLTPITLRKVLVEGAPVRPYLKTRMPRFGAGNIEGLVSLLDETDTLPAIEEVRVGQLNDFRNDGRKLVGDEAFACIACHSFKGRKTGSMAVVDLTEMGQRLKREWFVPYLLDPQAFSPSTLMPGFWPGGKSSFTDLYEGDGMKQIHAIWSYLEEGYGAGDPRGLYREPMRLLATEHARMLRRSYRGVGKRGIGVGYPEGVNIVFNAEQMCLSAIWKGEFLDPAGVWTSQGHGTARPLNRPIELTNEPELVRLPDPTAAWPEAADRPAHLQFKGYTLDERRRPTFRYALENVLVTDFFSARGSEDGKSVLRRELNLHPTGDAGSGLVFRAARNERVIANGDGRFQVGEGLVIRVVAGQGMIVEGADGMKELRIAADPGAGRAQVTIDYLW